MSVGKSSISRMVKAKPAEGIVSLAPEVPAGDAAPVAEKKPAAKKAPPKTAPKTAPKKAPVKKASPKATPVKKAAAKSDASFPTYEIGQELPYWLL